MRLIPALFLALLAGCAPGYYGGYENDPDRVDSDIDLAVIRAFAQVQDWPFDAGKVWVIAEGGGDLKSWSFVSCRGGTTACAGSEGGAAGQVALTPDYTVIDGLYGRTFYLSPGGDGWVERGNALTPIAWEDEEPLPAIAVTAFEIDDGRAPEN